MRSASVKASIIIPVYNAGKYLRKSLNSVFRQTFREFEVICVDDGSTDDSFRILQEYRHKNNNLRILRQKNKGAGAARNNALAHAVGKYVFFMDADDKCDRELLERAILRAEKPSADIVCFNFERMDPEGKRKYNDGYHSQWLPPETKVFSYKDCPDRILSIVHPTPWNKLFRREFIVDNDLKFEEISSTNDITFSAVSCAVAERIAILDEVLYCYRIGHGNTITSTKKKNLNNVVIAIESTIRQTKELGYFQEIKKAVACFAADNYIYSMDHYMDNLETPESEAFYNVAHECMKSDLFEGISQEDVWNQELYSKLMVVRKYDAVSLKKMLQSKVVVSMTSYPKRIGMVSEAIQSLLLQTRKADEIVLWLAESEFPGKEADLPEEVLSLVEKGELTIKWCDDLKPHKKYYYAFQEYPEALIITVDDDLLYESKMIQKLLTSYLLQPEAVSAMRAHLMLIEDNTLLPYSKWVLEYDGCIGEKSMQLLCTGGAGALYPARLFKNVQFDKAAIFENCLYADDIWLKIIEVMEGIPVVVACPHIHLNYIPKTQDERLYDYNYIKNDEQLSKSIKWLDSQCGKDFFIKQLTDTKNGRNLNTATAIKPFYEKKYNRIRERLLYLESTKGYKLMKPPTMLVRRIRELSKQFLYYHIH